MQLFYKDYPANSEPLIILHGLFGLADNWHSLANKWKDSFRVIAVDLRNHGQSPHDNEHSYDAMASDVIGLMDSLGLEKAHLLGHSMGGKVAMLLALKFPQRVNKLIIADMAPVKYKGGHEGIFRALFNLDLSDPNKKRSELDAELALGIPEFGVRQFLLKSLIRTDNGFAWKFNLKALYAHYQEILDWPETPLTFEPNTLFIKGEQSGYVKDEYLPTVAKYFPNYNLQSIEKAGHWVHAENPEAFSQAVLSYLKSK